MATGSDPKGWWTTLPGMLTAVAGLLTALTGLLVALNQIGVLGGGEPPSPDSVTATTAEDREDPAIVAMDDLSGEAATSGPSADGGPSDEGPGAVVLRYYDALRAGDWAGVQATLAPNAEIDVAALRMVRSQAGALNQLSDQLTTLFEVPEETKGGAPAPAPGIGEVRVEGVRKSGRNARVVVAPADGVAPARHTMELVRAGGGWRILRQGAAP